VLEALLSQLVPRQIAVKGKKIQEGISSLEPGHINKTI
jgi:hypothetical protein